MKLKCAVKYIFAVICFTFILLVVRKDNAFAEEPKEIYLDQNNGDDSNDGSSLENAVKTFDKAYELAGNGGTIYPTNWIDLMDSGEKTIENVTIKKKTGIWSENSGSRDYLIQVGNKNNDDTQLTLKNVVLDGGDCDGNTSGGLIVFNASWPSSGGVLNIMEGTVLKNVNNGSNTINIQSGGVLNMYGGEISSNKCDGTSRSGSAVNVASGCTFNMYGGEIKNNTGRAGTIYINSWQGNRGAFNMYGGKIEYNTVLSNGGGVDNYGGNILLQGGTISNNKAVQGGGVYIEGWGTNILDGTVITENTATAGSYGYGAGIALMGREQSPPADIQEEDKVTVLQIRSGSVTNNTAEGNTGGGGIFARAYRSSCYIDISGGTIADNTIPAPWNGAAIKFYEDSPGTYTAGLRLSGSPKISGDVSLTSTGKVEVTEKFTPENPVTLVSSPWTDYRPIVEYAQGLTADVAQFDVRDDMPRYGYIKEADKEVLDCINKKLVTFNNGTEDCGMLYVNPNEKLEADQAPEMTVKEGYTFAGWSTDDGDIWDFDKDTVTGDITLTAVWRENIKISTADMTIYTGGESGYTGVVNDASGTFVSSDSLPEPGFYITLPAEAGEAQKLIFKEKAADAGGYTGKEWKLELYGEGTSDLYRLIPNVEGQEPVRVSFTDAQGNMQTNDSFNIEEALSVEYSIDIYPGSVDQGNIVAVTEDGTEYTVETGESGKLTVRGVTGTETVSAVTEGEPAKPVSTVTASAPADTEYTINDSDVQIPADGKPALLADEVARSEESVPLLIDRAEQEIGADGTGLRQYEFKYLDLVDSYNGNMWIASSKGTDIYWPYPEGTDEDTEFTILHYKGLHRSGVDETDLAGEIVNSEVEVFKANTEGALALENTEKGIKIHVSKGNFSPFALVWDTPTKTEGQDPAKPGTSDNTGDSGKTENGKDTQSSVETGDNRDAARWSILLCVSICLITGVGAYQKSGTKKN